LQLHSNQFERHSRRVQNKMLMQNLKGWLIIGLIVSVLLTILIVIFHSSENSPGQSSTDARVHHGDGLNMTMYT